MYSVHISLMINNPYNLKPGDTVQRVFKYRPVGGFTSNGVEYELMPKSEWVYTNAPIVKVYDTGVTTSVGEFLPYDSDVADFTKINMGDARVDINIPKPAKQQ